MKKSSKWEKIYGRRTLMDF